MEFFWTSFRTFSEALYIIFGTRLHHWKHHREASHHGRAASNKSKKLNFSTNYAPTGVKMKPNDRCNCSFRRRIWLWQPFSPKLNKKSKMQIFPKKLLFCHLFETSITGGFAPRLSEILKTHFLPKNNWIRHSKSRPHVGATGIRPIFCAEFDKNHIFQPIVKEI